MCQLSRISKKRESLWSAVALATAFWSMRNVLSHELWSAVALATAFWSMRNDPPNELRLKVIRAKAPSLAPTQWRKLAGALQKGTPVS